MRMDRIVPSRRCAGRGHRRRTRADRIRTDAGDPIVGTIRRMFLAAVQFDIAWEDKPRNHALVADLVHGAGLPRGALIVLPELFDTGFSFALERIVDDRTLPWAADLARRTGSWIQVGFATRGADGRGRNCAVILRPDGSIGPTYEKLHPFGFGRETEYFTGGTRIVLAEVGGLVAAPFICYDLRFPEAMRHAVAAGAELLTFAANWPDARHAHWRALLIARAIENQAFVVGVNRTGRDPHLAYAGGSIIVGPTGEILAEAGREPTVLTATVDPHALRSWRRTFPALRDQRRALLGACPIERDPAAT